jgi:hypothetical protein
MRKFINLVESLDRLPVEGVIEYFTEEGCASFAYALWIAHGKPAGATLDVISDPNGEGWEDFEYEFTHVVYASPENVYIDVRGVQTQSEILEHWHGSFEDSFEPDHFWQMAVGDSDDKPLYGDEATVKEALDIIREFPDLYGVPK